MSVSTEQAVDDTLALLNAMWVTTGYTMLWPYKPGDPPITQVPWGKVKIQHFDGRKLTIGDAEGKALYERKARLVVEISFPVDKSFNDMYPLAQSVGNVFEGKKTASGVRFYDTALHEVGLLEGWLKINVVTTMKYEEYK